MELIHNNLQDSGRPLDTGSAKIKKQVIKTLIEVNDGVRLNIVFKTIT
jgi:hypothetical protein